MQQWLGLFVEVTKPVLTTLVYTGINSWLEAFQEEIKDRQKDQAKRVLDSFTVNEEITNYKQVALKTSKNSPPLNSKKYSELWPLRLSSEQLLKNYSGFNSNSLKILVAPPKKKLGEFSHLDLETRDIEQRISQGLRDFLQKNYLLHDPSKTTELLSGLWNNSNFYGEASIKVLFDILQSLPTIVLYTEIEGNEIAFYLAYWGKNSQTYSYEKIFKFNYKAFLEESVKARVANWKAIRNQLLTLGKSKEDIQRLGGNCEFNLSLIEEAQVLQQAGIDIEKLTFPYQFDQQDFDPLCQFLTICNCLVAGWVADIHYLINEDIPPHLPIWLPPLGEVLCQEFTNSSETQQANSQFQQAIFRGTVSLYQDVLTVLANESSQDIPELSLKLAESLMHLADSNYAIAQIEYSFDCWRQQRQLSFPKTVEDLEALSSCLSQKDWQYLDKLKRCLSTFREEEEAEKITSIREIVNNLNQKASTSITIVTESQNNFQLHHTVTIVAEKVFSLGIHSNGNQLIGQRQNNTLKLWHLEANNGHLSPSHELRGHSGKIQAVNLCREGKLLASSDTTDKRSYIKIWHLTTGKLMRTLFGHRQPIEAIAIHHGFCPFLASGSHKIKLWDINTGESWLTLFGHKEKVHCLAISNDGQTLISGSQDKTIRIWNLKTGDLLQTLRGHQDSVNSVVVTDDGQTLVSGSKDKTIKLWNLKTGKLLYTLTGHEEGLQALTLDDQSQYLISGCEAGMIHLWDIQTGKLLQSLKGHEKGIRALAFSPDRQRLISSCQAGMVQIWKPSIVNK